MKTIDFNSITLRISVTTRGGGVEINLDSLGYPNGKMTAYQNYLGGGMLGAVAGDCTVKDWRKITAQVNDTTGKAWRSNKLKRNEKPSWAK